MFWCLKPPLAWPNSLGSFVKPLGQPRRYWISSANATGSYYRHRDVHQSGVFRKHSTLYVYILLLGIYYYNNMFVEIIMNMYVCVCVWMCVIWLPWYSNDLFLVTVFSRLLEQTKGYFQKWDLVYRFAVRKNDPVLGWPLSKYRGTNCSGLNQKLKCAHIRGYRPLYINVFVKHVTRSYRPTNADVNTWTVVLLTRHKQITVHHRRRRHFDIVCCTRANTFLNSTYA